MTTRTTRRYVPCAGCVRRGEPKPNYVRATRDSQPRERCNACADIEEGAL